MSDCGRENPHIGLLPCGEIHREVQFRNLHQALKWVGCRMYLKVRVNTTPASRTEVRACPIVVVKTHI